MLLPSKQTKTIFPHRRGSQSTAPATDTPLTVNPPVLSSEQLQQQLQQQQFSPMDISTVSNIPLPAQPPQATAEQPAASADQQRQVTDNMRW